jgi:spoIIIJ-associated protein
MPHCLEFDGINVEKAIETACKDLKISKENLKYDIISYGSSGIFGLVGVKKARISVDLNGINNGNVREEEKINIQREPSSGLNAKGADGQKSVEIAAENYKNINAEKGREALNYIINTICDDTVINLTVAGTDLFFEIESGTPSVIIGKKGQTLDAIQYLVEKIVNKNNGEKLNVNVDIGGYLSKRHEKLKKLAEKIAEKSKAKGKPMSLGQMNANDRRIIHLCLKNDDEVKTHSIGEGFVKKLVIYPKKRVHSAQAEKTS